MSSESWPPQLKEWVATCLGQMTDSNREEAQAELRQVIADSFVNKTLWTTDWQGVQLQSLLPKPPPTFNVFNSLKRKASDNNPAATNKKVKKSAITRNATASALDPSDQDALKRRAARFQREHEIEKQKQRGNQRSSVTSRSVSQYHSRSATPGYFGGDDPEADPNVPNWDRFTIVGTNQEILKDYLRLTSEPKPETIRPYEVLQKTLTELKNRWKEKCNYNWICSQLKSLRQDLTVQRIKNDFTVEVYEIHARIALEVSDLVEYNACQGMLRNLYDLGLRGHAEEFIAYRILMLIHGRNRSDLNLYVGQLTPAQKSAKEVKHALSVQRAISMGNYHSLFTLYYTCPNMGGYIMDHFINRERARALIVMSKAYKTLPLTFITSELAFETTVQATEFLQNHSTGYFTNPNSPDEEKTLDCKLVSMHLLQIYEERYRKVQIKGAV